MTKKKKLGQFFTTNSDYILQGFEHHIKNKNVLDPFCGQADLLKWADKNQAKSISGLDIDDKLINSKIKKNDSLKYIPSNEFCITNPPYLSKNHMSKSFKNSTDLEGYEDLYLLSIKKIIESNTNEGVLIIPVNFLSAENSEKLRREFLDIYEIPEINYFTEQVFEDTAYNVISFYFYKKKSLVLMQNIKIKFLPDNFTTNFILDQKFNYKIAGEELEKINNAPPIRCVRLIENNLDKGSNKIDCFFNDKKTSKTYNVSKKTKNKIDNNIILLNCIDTNSSKESWINAENIQLLNKSCLVGKNTSRNIAYILTDIPINDQVKIIKLFNKTLNNLREKYNSLFLTNFRDNNRKRISFDFCYKLISYCWQEIK